MTAGRRVRGCAAAVLALGLAGAAAADEPRVEVSTVGGERLGGALREAAPTLVIQTADGLRELEWSQLLTLRNLDAQRAAAAPAEGLYFVLTDGSEFGAKIETVTEQGFVARLPAGPACRLSTRQLRAVRRHDVPGEAAARLAELRADVASVEDAAVVLREKDVLVLRGVVRGVSDSQVLFAWKERELPIPWERLAGVVLAEVADVRERCAVRLTTGEVFSGTLRPGKGDEIELRSDVFDGIPLRWAQIERIDCQSARVVYLSDLMAAEYKFEPFFQKNWPLAEDAGFDGAPLQLGGAELPRGVVMHSRSRATYRLGGRFRQFAATVGILDAMGARGDAAARVEVDGAAAWSSDNLRGGEPPVDVVIDVSGAESLTLIVDFGADLDFSDQVCWGLARLLR